MCRLRQFSTGQELSKDPTYQQSQRKKGILRWDVEVPGQSTGHKAMAIEHQFKLEYEKQMSIAGTPKAAGQ